MIVLLDHWIFGNGHGLKSPFLDDRFYWLSGEMYNWCGWYGAQLQSFQWRHPRAGEERELNGRKFRPVHSERKWMWLRRTYCGINFPLPVCRVRVSWGTRLPEKIDEANVVLQFMRKELEAL